MAEQQLIINAFELNNINIFRRLNLGDIPTDEVIATSQLGTPVFDNLVFESGSFLNAQNDNIAYEGMTINTVLFDVRQSKNIVKTFINGRNGSIKEFVSDGDFDVTMRLVLVSDFQNVYPEAEVNTLKNILKVPDSIKVTSKYLNRLGIFELVITDYSLPQREGFYHMQLAQINAISETPFEIRKREEV